MDQSLVKEQSFIPILREFLDESGLTQAEFARRIGVKPAQVCEWLKGKAKPGYDTLRAMSLAFSVPADYFLGLIDNYI